MIRSVAMGTKWSRPVEWPILGEFLPSCITKSDGGSGSSGNPGARVNGDNFKSQG